MVTLNKILDYVAMMMKSKGLRKGLAVSIIVLLCGVVFVPSIYANIDKPALDSELVEVSTEICGLPGQKPHTVQLTQEEVEAVERLFDEIKNKLDSIESREAAERIFNRALLELNKYGLLPDGMSVKETQKLVTGKFQNLQHMMELNGRHQKAENGNFLCLVAGETSWTLFGGLGCMIFGFLGMFFDKLSEWASRHYLWELEDFLYECGTVLLIIAFNLLLFSEYINPIPIGHIIIFGGEEFPTTGWIHTIGLNGKKSYEGTIQGEILGFSGVKLYLGDDGFRYLGFALSANIRSV